MNEEEAERPTIKCQGQVTLVRLPYRNENPEQGKVSTIVLTSDVPCGYLYLRQSQGYDLGDLFEVEITLRQIPAKEFFIKKGLKPIPETSGGEPI